MLLCHYHHKRNDDSRKRGWFMCTAPDGGIGCADPHGRFITNGETLADHSNAAKLHREALEQGLINAAEVEEWDRNTHGVLPKNINDGPRMGDWWDNYQRTQSARDDQDDSGYEGDLSDAKSAAARYEMCEPPF